MAVRPFYIEADIEGRATTLGGGPGRHDGTTRIQIHQRDRGSITTPFTIVQEPRKTEDGSQLLVTQVFYQGELLKEHITRY